MIISMGGLMGARFGRDHLYGGVVGRIVLIDSFRLI